MAPLSQSIENTAGSLEELQTRRYKPASIIPNSDLTVPRCSVSIIIGGELPEIRAECHCYHANTTSKREQERQCCNEGLHGQSPVQNGDRSALERIASVEKHGGIDTKIAA